MLGYIIVENDSQMSPMRRLGWVGDRARVMGAMTERRLSPQGAGDRPPVDKVSADCPRRVPLARILGTAREIVIEFNGADYRLRITRNQKLILTK